jgi:hypothetical protein
LGEQVYNLLLNRQRLVEVNTYATDHFVFAYNFGAFYNYLRGFPVSTVAMGRREHARIVPDFLDPFRAAEVDFHHIQGEQVLVGLLIAMSTVESFGSQFLNYGPRSISESTDGSDESVPPVAGAPPDARGVCARAGASSQKGRIAPHAAAGGQQGATDEGDDSTNQNIERRRSKRLRLHRN